MPVPTSPSRPLWATFVLLSGLLLFSGVVFALGWLTGRWTAPVEVGYYPRLEPGETWSLHISRIVATSQDVRNQEYYAIVKALQQYTERRPEYTHVIDDFLCVLCEDHEARAKPIPHLEYKGE